MICGMYLCNLTWLEGSPRIGTKDYAKEAPILEAMDEGNAS